jgi:mRNA-degrading endonuclease toxin of MazEF toxin-antitoxin module
LGKESEYRKGDIVYTHIEYSNAQEGGQQGKDRTTLILIDCGVTCVVCSISKNGINRDAIRLNSGDCKEGKASLEYDPSYALYKNLHTISKNKIRRKIGELTKEKLDEVIDSLKKSLDEPRILESKPKAIERPQRRRLI